MVKVSVIIPVYNTEKYLRKCLDSVCGQTLSDIEIICINDCSTDGSLQILQEYAANDNRIKLIDFEKNQGAATARNKGLDIAQGEYIGFVDSDDWIDLDFYEKLYQKAIETGADVVKGNIVQYLENIDKLEVIKWDDNNKIACNKSSFIYGFTTAIYKNSFLLEKKIKFPQHLINYEDPYFLIQVMFYCNKICFVSNLFYYYRKNLMSVTHHLNPIEDLKSAREILKLINSLPLTKDSYLVIFYHFFSDIFNKCSFFPQNQESLKLYSKLFYEFVSQALYDDAIYYYFNKKNESMKEEKMKLIRVNFLNKKKDDK